jgi:hypothetical protein
MEYIMKLSKNTIDILKNFSTVNSGFLFKQGKTLKTISRNKNIFAEYNFFNEQDEITSEFGIYDLNNFLTAISMFGGDVDIKHEDGSCKVTSEDGRNRLQYVCCDAEMLTLPPEKPVAMPEAEIKFTLSKNDYDWVKKISSIIGSTNLAFKSNGSKVSVLVYDAKDSSASRNELEIADGNGDVYEMVFKLETLIMLPGEYDISISSKGISNFKHKQLDLQYWITTEPGSTFTKG